MIDLERARGFLQDHRHGVLATIRRDGRPQLSNILYVLDDDEYLIVDGTVELIEGNGLAEKLRDYYRKAAGEHPDASCAKGA